MSAARPGRQVPVGLDAEALLVALVLDPATYSRNRFFDLYGDPAVRRVRRRAAMVRSLLRHLSGRDVSSGRSPGGRDVEGRGEVLATVAEEGGWVEVSYTVPRLGLRRTMRLEALELSLVRFAIARAEGRDLPPEDVDRVRVEAALRGLVDALATRGSAGSPTPTPPPPPATGTGA